MGLRQVDSGNYVTAAGNTPMLVITQLHPIAVVFTLPEDQLQAVAQQMKQGALEVDAYSRDDRTKLATGKLLTIDNQIDQTTGTAKLKAVFDNPDNSLWPNQFVNAHLLLETRKNAITAPASRHAARARRHFRLRRGRQQHRADAAGEGRADPGQLRWWSLPVCRPATESLPTARRSCRPEAAWPRKTPARQNQQSNGNIGSQT